jgi:hypothetical protein
MGKEDESVLDEHFHQEDDPEDTIVENGFEYVIFKFINNSAVDHVDNVHQHECVEAQGIFSKSVCW